MGKTFKKYDKDDYYHNVKREREQAKNNRKQKHKREYQKEENDSNLHSTKYRN